MNKLEIEINDATLERLGNALGWCREVNGQVNKMPAIVFVMQNIAGYLEGNFERLATSLKNTGVILDPEASKDNILVGITKCTEDLSEFLKGEEAAIEEAVAEAEAEQSQSE